MRQQCIGATRTRYDSAATAGARKKLPFADGLGNGQLRPFADLPDRSRYGRKCAVSGRSQIH
jgi:hypothetical protein